MYKITSAAVLIKDLRQDKEFFIPCHRHADAYYTLMEFGYKPKIDYRTIEEGFLDSQWNFLNRSEAYKRAIECNQINYKKDIELYSEDLW